MVKLTKEKTGNNKAQKKYYKDNKEEIIARSKAFQDKKEEFSKLPVSERRKRIRKKYEIKELIG